ncbi:MAG: acyltransferase [Vitreimonas sp.]
MSGQTSSDHGRFVVLDGMRGLAAIAVIMDHVTSVALQGLFPGRALAVDFFFVLSGFVLSYVYGERLRTGMSFFSFMRVRVIRLYPLYFLGTLMGAALALLQATKHWIPYPPINALWAFLCGIFFIPCPPQVTTEWLSIYPLDGPGWSLFFELVVNVAFALLITRLSWRFLIGLLAVAVPPLLYCTIWTGSTDMGWSWENVIGGFPRVTYGFFAGVLVYKLWTTVKIPALPAWAAFVVLIAVFMFPIPERAPFRWIFDVLAATVIFPILVAVSAGAQAKGLLLKASAKAGALSYSVYILHVPIWNWAKAMLPIVAPWWNAIPGFVHYFMIAAIAVTAAAILDQIYDRPLRRWLARPRKRSPLLEQAGNSRGEIG